ncbi:antibiotic biosynthesis monooxygenase [Rhodospirillaceae bacterium KN72]|uniref:Antibiotic biosynthesis monooxygenase n=1 Tax=Pacificispira spongiicola TaxID=2729598 RepID=A0A7Y0E394_9PROT|nr:antibiotic biosynthesis monooxygenase [Pacificispira spongiicola]NMM46424.1 antibiotic biosynthesis monooxygenase [Pacificispira spongiicola]
MFVAMNRFTIVPGCEAEFEDVWRNRKSTLHEMEGFVSFHLLKGPDTEDGALYASHTIWKDRGSFEAWTQSDNFRQAHANAGNNKKLYVGPPKFEGFESVVGD